MEAIAYPLSKELILGQVLALPALKIPHQEVLIVEDRKFPYREFNNPVNHLAQTLLAVGIRVEGKVAFGQFTGNEIMECL